MSTDYTSIAETVERAERLAEDGASVGVRMLLLEARGMIDGALQRGEPGQQSQPTIAPLLAAMVAGSKRLSDDLTLTGRDLLEARAKDAAREVAHRLVGVLLPADTSEEQANKIADEIAAPLVQWLRQYHQANEYGANVRNHFGTRVGVAERKLERIQEQAASLGLPESAAEELRCILASEDGRTF
ncbi:hypothetical protein [Streptomyces sp. 11x1]|uniref:hypothetical protein n=1 Tax=Streptomyces sp. 11x1 TaxID=3038642 RepID=UPI00293004B5|nr:hypothetical protein [Streptomyces sp. 11x1]WNZ14883.1 hypothetical protein P8T65_46455 [Streptomyces sp. 11x1]